MGSRRPPLRELSARRGAVAQNKTGRKKEIKTSCHIDGKELTNNNTHIHMHTHTRTHTHAHTHTHTYTHTVHTHIHTQTYTHTHRHTHTHTHTHTHILVLVAHCQNWSRGSPRERGERLKRNLGKMTQLAIEPPNGRHPLKSPKLWVDLKMIPLMGSPHLSKWVRTRCRKRIDGIRVSVLGSNCRTPAPSEGNTCY